MEKFKSLFDLRHDQDENTVIDHSIRAGQQIEGTNLWVLIFAILIASVGLNVNLMAVVIGAWLAYGLVQYQLFLAAGRDVSAALKREAGAVVLRKDIRASIAIRFAECVVEVVQPAPARPASPSRKGHP